MKTKHPHVVLDLKTGAFRCNHCRREYTMAMPAPLDVFIASGKSWTRLHRGCTKPKPSKPHG